MGYVKDTCVFITNIDNNLDLITNIDSCKKIGKKVYITDIILRELRPPKKILDELSKKEKDKKVMLYDTVKNMLEKNIHKSFVKIDVEMDKKYKKNYKSLRDRYYGHLTDPEFIKKSLENGDLTYEEFKNKNFYYKDAGECSCIAITMEHNHIKIVTNDKGRVFLKPDFNLFEACQKIYEIEVLNYEEWEKEVINM